MGYVFYFGFGILTHLITWGSSWFGLASLALVIFWPFYLFFWLGLWVVVIALIVFTIAFVLDFFGVKGIF